MAWLAILDAEKYFIAVGAVMMEKWLHFLTDYR